MLSGSGGQHHDRSMISPALFTTFTRINQLRTLQDRKRIQAGGGVVFDHHTPLHETWMLNPLACRTGRDAPHHLALIGICDHSSDFSTCTIEVTGFSALEETSCKPLQILPSLWRNMDFSDFVLVARGGKEFPYQSVRSMISPALFTTFTRINQLRQAGSSGCITKAVAREMRRTAKSAFPVYFSLVLKVSPTSP